MNDTLTDYNEILDGCLNYVVNACSEIPSFVKRYCYQISKAHEELDEKGVKCNFSRDERQYSFSSFINQHTTMYLFARHINGTILDAVEAGEVCTNSFERLSPEQRNRICRVLCKPIRNYSPKC